jgi:murein DD-endopeptidase MepM/ murein hydrolase activator NlpD
MVQFDPLKRGNTKIGTFLNRSFPEKEIIIRGDNKITHYVISTYAQAILFLMFLVLVAWFTFSSVVYFARDQQIRERDSEISEVKEAYSQVVSEIAVYRDYVKKIKDEMGQSYQSAIASVEKKLTAPEKETMQRNYKMKMAEMDLIADKVEKLSQELIQSSSIKKSTDYKMRDVMLEREVALEMKKELMRRNKLLEKALIEMRDANMQVFERVETLTDNGVDNLEDMLDKIKESLSKIGLDNKKLIRKSESLIPKGGPFSPAPMPSLPDDKLAQKFREVNEKLEYWRGLINISGLLPLGNPVHSMRITSPFGTRVDPFNGNPAMHKGIDFAGALNTPLYSTAPGKVIRAGVRGDYGNAVEVDHGLGFTTVYGHLNKILVKVGQKVQTGDKIGLAGSTGRSTGVHLHYEVRYGGRQINPYNFVKAKKNVFDS